jgi:alkaline phosphatase
MPGIKKEGVRLKVHMIMAVLTGAGVEAKLNPDKTNVAEVMAKYYGINELTGEEIKAIASAEPGELNYTVGPMISKCSLIGWTTTGHTGEDTALYSYGPSRPMGVIDNTEIARIIAGSYGFSLDELNKKLFVPARKTFESMGATVSYNGSDPLNPSIDVVKGNIKMNLPINTSMVKINGEAKYMQGLTVMTADITYVPQEAIDIFTAATAL